MKFNPFAALAFGFGLVSATWWMQTYGVEHPPRIEVIDGDTFWFGKERVRLWGIDAPELEQTCLDEGLARYRCGQNAKAALMFLLENRQVKCLPLAKDRFDRRIAQCSAGSGDIGALMVRSGWAVDYTLYSRSHYEKDEKLAREAKRGLWSGPFTRPEDYRRSKGD